MTNDDNFNKSLERFKLILQTRDFEIEMFWKRCNYFLVLNTALAVGVFASFGGNKAILPLICLAGAFVCYAWFQVGLGSKFWQSHWEQIAEEMQDDIGFRKDDGGDYRKDYFSRKGADVRVNRNLFPPGKEHHWLKFFYNNQVMKKPSVSGWMQITAVTFFFVWLLGLGIWVLWICGFWALPLIGVIWVLWKYGFWTWLWMWLCEGIRVLCKMLG